MKIIQNMIQLIATFKVIEWVIRSYNKKKYFQQLFLQKLQVKTEIEYCTLPSFIHRDIQYLVNSIIAICF